MDDLSNDNIISNYDMPNGGRKAATLALMGIWLAIVLRPHPSVFPGHVSTYCGDAVIMVIVGCYIV